MTFVHEGLLAKITRTLIQTGNGFIVEETAAPLGLTSTEIGLFNATVAAAFLALEAEKVSDSQRRATFRGIIAEVSNGFLPENELSSLLDDLGEQLEEHGLEMQARRVAHAIVQREQQLEALRVAVLLAHIDGGLTENAHRAIELLACNFGLDGNTVSGLISSSITSLQQ